MTTNKKKIELKQEFKGYYLFELPRTVGGKRFRMDIPDDAGKYDLLNAIEFLQYLIHLRKD